MLRPWIVSTLVFAGLALSWRPGLWRTSPSSRFRTRRAVRTRSSPGPTEISGSPSPTAARSAGSRRAGRSPSSRSSGRTAGRTGSRSAQTATSGSPSATGTRSGRSRRTVSITEYPIPTPDAQPWDITALPNGDLWFTEETVDQVGRSSTERRDRRIPERHRPVPDVHRDRAGRQRLVHRGDREQHRPARSREPARPDGVPAAHGGALPWDINLGPDGNLWFTELAGRHIGKITMQGDDHGVPGRRQPRDRRDRGRTRPGTRCGSPRTTRSTSATITVNGNVGDERFSNERLSVRDHGGA